MSLKTYLQKHFVDKPTFVSLLGITVERLDQLIAAKAVPQPTYVCDGNTIHSAVFGVIETEESIYGDYFRPECSRWVKIADQAAPGQERDAVFSVLSHELELGLQDYFKEPEIIEKKIQDFLPYFLNGTFGLCIADPSSGTSIARKEVLQDTMDSKISKSYVEDKTIPGFAWVLETIFQKEDKLTMSWEDFPNRNLMSFP
mgnify:CR=1 FL=1